MPDEINDIDDIEEITRDETVEDLDAEVEEDLVLPSDPDTSDLGYVEDEDQGHEDTGDEVLRPVKEKKARRVVAKKVTRKVKSNKAKKRNKIAKKVLAKRKLAPKSVKKVIKKVAKVVKSKHKEHKEKEHKHKEHKVKSHKRGPKGPQWTNWKIPFQENSVSGKLFILAMNKHGITLKELTKISKKAGASPERNWKLLRGGKCRGWVWEVDDSHGRIRVSKPHIER